MESKLSGSRADGADRPRLPWGGAMLFAAGVLGLGLLAAALGMTYRPTGGTTTGGPLPAWVFWAIWIVIYPGMGVATWLVWRQRERQPVRGALLLFGVALAQNLSFWLAPDLAGVAMVDLAGCALAYLVTCRYARIDRAAGWWLLPWLVWMPLTTALKLWLLWLGQR